MEIGHREERHEETNELIIILFCTAIERISEVVPGCPDLLRNVSPHPFELLEPGLRLYLL